MNHQKQELQFEIEQSLKTINESDKHEIELQEHMLHNTHHQSVQDYQHDDRAPLKNQTDTEQQQLGYVVYCERKIQNKPMRNSSEKKKINNMYIPLAILASAFNAVGYTVRGYESKSILATAYIFASAWIVVPSAYLIYKKAKSLRNSEQPFTMPWYQDLNNGGILDGRPMYKFSLAILLLLFLGGACEFVGCQLLMIAYHFGQLAELNDGITTSLVLFSPVFIIVGSYFIFRDKINLVQGLGLSVILLGVLIISVFKAPSAQEVEEGAEIDAQPSIQYKLTCVICGLLAASSYGGEVLFIRKLGIMKVDGDLCGYFYAFFIGILGMISLAIYAMTGELAKENFTQRDYILILLGGASESVGMVLQSLAASIGVGGIAFGISNACCVYVLLFNYFVLGQAITAIQVMGLIMTLGGASIVALEDQIYHSISKKSIK